MSELFRIGEPIKVSFTINDVRLGPDRPGSFVGFIHLDGEDKAVVHLDGDEQIFLRFFDISRITSR